MKIEKKKLILLCVRYFLYLALSISIVVFGYIYTVVDELQLKISEASISKASISHQTSQLEGDASVLKNDLIQFSSFFQNPSQNFIQTLMDENKLTTYKNSYIIEGPIELPEMLENDCVRFNCIQFKRKFSDIPSAVWKGLLGTEDFRFLDHKGVDPIAIARALIVDIIAMKFIQGGSTLTQQLVKNLFLSNEKKISRKLKEMIYALYIENVLSKEEIITLYLNEVFWGTFQGVYLKGFYAASLAYFNKAPKFLSEYEATMLVSLLKGPFFYRPTKNIDRIKDRTQAVFKRLQSLNLVSSSEKDFWSKGKWEIYQKDFIKRNNDRGFYYYYLSSKNVESQLEPFEKFVLYSSITRNKDLLKERIKDADIGVKILIADKKCENFDCAGVFSHYSKFQREKRKALITERHQIGSLFKPIVYDTFIEFGRSYDEEISTEPITLKLTSGEWSPKDYSKAKVKSMPLKKALQKSKNIPLIRVASEIGFDELEEALKVKIPNMQSPLKEYPAQLLGALELSVVDVFQTYNQFLKHKCEDIKRNKTPIEETILYYMSVASETTISILARGQLQNSYIFGKTGTSNNGLDNWYFAYDGKEVYVFYFGVESKRDQHDLRISGASSSFRIFQDFINYRGKLASEILCE